ncbi:MAG: biotin transporter BioY [Treponemataceae bacterium]|nr:MAG: biotin transporter BioY [Treponemataceae bacterium]
MRISQNGSRFASLYTFSALFAAIIAVSSIVAIPLPLVPVPIVVKDACCILSGALLGAAGGAIAVALYILAGLIGLPVFAGASGIAIFSTPSGGYIIGFLLSSFVAGLILGKPQISEKKESVFKYVKIVVALLAAWVVLYGCGVAYIMFVIVKPSAQGLTVWQLFRATLLTAVVPFLPVAAFKSVIIIALTSRLRPIAANYIH